VTGLCNRQSCPLANSRYATIRSSPETGRLYLFTRTVERSHTPAKWWERVRLSNNYAEALEQVDSRLKYWPKFLVHKCKQRLTRLTQVAIRTKRLAKEEERLGERTVARLAPKVRRREQTRERKAEAAARVERAIERELIERLRSGAYGDRPLNVEEGIWKKVLKGLERGGEGERDKDLDEGVEESEEENEFEEEEELENEGDVEYVSDLEGESDGDLGDLEDWLGGESGDDDEAEDDDEAGEDDSDDSSEGEEDVTEALKKALAGLKRKRADAPPPKPAKKSNKGPRTNIEYEIETEPAAKEGLYA